MSITRRFFNGARRKRTVGVLLAAGAVAATMLVVIPALGTEHENAVRLHMAADGQYFKYGELNQPIETTPNGKKSCEVKTDTLLYGTLVTPSATNGGPLPVGNVDFSLGVKSAGSNSNGTPCSQVQIGETLTLTKGTGIALADKVFNAARFDVEATSDAVIKVTFVGSSTQAVFYLETGTSIVSGSPVIDANPLTVDSTGATGRVTTEYGQQGRAFGCITANSSGPNNSSSDNCAWTVKPGIRFTEVILSVVGPPNGSVSLEGSSDWGGNKDYDTLLYVDAAPVARNDSYSTNEDTPLIAALGVLDNDSDVDGDSLTAALVSGPSYGNLSLDSDGGFTYTPNANFNGSDSFTYQASDGAALSNVATVSITVNPENDAPVAANDSYSTNEDTPLIVGAALGVLDNDSDVDGDSLTAALVSGPSNGSLALAPDGSFTYTPDSTYVWPVDEFSYEDSFQYTAFDGVDQSNSATVTVTVYRVICTEDTVPFSSLLGTVYGSVTKITGEDDLICKRFEIIASDPLGEDPGTLLFKPVGDGLAIVKYRVFVDFPASAGPVPPTPTVPFGLQYDPDDVGPAAYRPLLMCIDPVFELPAGELVESAALPLITDPNDPLYGLYTTETWCIASFSGVATTDGNFQVTWQLYGEGDPGFRKG